MNEVKCPTCSVPIEDHPASRCLDAWVAEKVMDLPCIDLPPGHGKDCPRHSDQRRYSTSIEAAWEVVASITSRQAGRCFIETDEDRSDCTFKRWRDDAEFHAFANLIPLAICRAAIVAKDAEK